MTGYTLFSLAGTCVKVSNGIPASGQTSPVPTSCTKGYYLASDSNGINCAECNTKALADSCYNGDSG